MVTGVVMVMITDSRFISIVAISVNQQQCGRGSELRPGRCPGDGLTGE